MNKDQLTLGRFYIFLIVIVNNTAIMHFVFLFEVILSHTPTTILMHLLSTY